MDYIINYKYFKTHLHEIQCTIKVKFIMSDIYFNLRCQSYSNRNLLVQTILLIIQNAYKRIRKCITG